VPVSADDPELQELFGALKLKSRELVMVLRVSAILPRQSNGSGLSPLLTRRLEMFILKKEVPDAGSLADFMANIVESTYEEKLQVLAAFDVKERVAKVIELLDRQVGGLKSNFKITTFTSAPAQIIMDRLNNRRNQPSGLSLPFAVLPPGAHNPTSSRS
jgi:ATP-dependent Lon protease